MAVASVMHNARCLDCGASYYDPDEDRPCPRCRSSSIEALASAPAPAAAKPAQKQATAGRRPLLPWDRIPAFLLGASLVAIWWAFGAKYTIDGLPLLVNLLAGWFHLTFRLAPVGDGIWYLRLCWLPILVSLVERQYQPWRRRGILSRKAYWLPVIWLIVVGVDFGSTYLAVTAPATDAWPLTVTIATTVPLAIGWSLLTTFGPESGLTWFWQWLRSA